MLLKENTQYVLRNGELVGPLYLGITGWLQVSNAKVDGSYIGIWKEDGKSDFFYYSDQEPEYDIVSEVE